MQVCMERRWLNDLRENDIANLRFARIIKEVSLMMVQLSETAEILLKRIVESRLGSGSGLGLFLMYESMVEHLIWEEARRRKLTDEDIKEEKK